MVGGGEGVAVERIRIPEEVDVPEDDEIVSFLRAN